MKNTSVFAMLLVAVGLWLLTPQSANCFFSSQNGRASTRADLVTSSQTGTPALSQHGPSGELLTATDPMAKANPFRLSTKHQDGETDLVYYGYRYYSACKGSWISRDPLGERETLNLLVFNGNSPLSFIDRLGDRRAPSVGLTPASFERASAEPTQLAEFERSLMADWIKFRSALEALCPDCGAATFTGGNGKQECTHDKCIEQAHRLATYLMQSYNEVFHTEYQKFGDILTGWRGNVRADEAPFHGQIAADYDKGFGLKCAGWMDLTADTFFNTISPFYKEHSQCFRAAIVGSPRNSGSYWNHSWVIIYGPQRGQLNTSMYNKGDYDVNVDPWPFSGRLIMNPQPWIAKRFDQPLLW